MQFGPYAVFLNGYEERVKNGTSVDFTIIAVGGIQK
jgi:hypothetical protein